MKILLCFYSIFCFLIVGCSASGPTPEKSPEYQEIQPGDKSVITPPNIIPENRVSPVEEKNL